MDPALLVHQLCGPDAYAVDLAAPVRPAEPWTGTRPACVLLCSRGLDAEFDALQASLAVVGVPTARLDADALGARSLAVMPNGEIRLDGHAIRPVVSWVRRFSTSAMPGGTGATDVLRRDSWQSLVGEVARRAPHVLPGPPIGLLHQLADAAGAGFRTPATVVTTAPASAADVLSGDRFVVKVLDSHFVEPVPGTAYGVFPEVVDRVALARHPSTDLPLVIQEYVAHQQEYRVYVVGGRVIAFDVRKPSAGSLWRDEAGVTIRPAEVPETVASRLRDLAGRWGLGFGAFDVLMVNGEPVFLEVNTAGDWLWFERRAGTRAVGAAVARMVADRYRGTAGVTPVNLLAFLAAPRAEGAPNSGCRRPG